ncbi:hypothetical protein B7P43_G16192 [Cryptotermes secundus]|uniref:Uncharacterized protein n=1 Tax=Cryptotermes secundus TaxID=105785 RepID=A0A2J7PV44_9NEOP|nr:hypothetical protein B7P43_G16192 [Cryptotermes secundus]
MVRNLSVVTLFKAVSCSVKTLTKNCRGISCPSYSISPSALSPADFSTYCTYNSAMSLASGVSSFVASVDI